MNSVDLTVLPQNLLLWQREKIYLLIQKDASVEEYEKLASTFLGENNFIGNWMNTAVPNDKKLFLPILKNEIFKFFCTNSDEYKEERVTLQGTLENIVKIVATAIASNLGVTEAIISGAVTCIIIAMLKIGKNAWCKIIEQYNSKNNL